MWVSSTCVRNAHSILNQFDWTGVTYGIQKNKERNRRKRRRNKNNKNTTNKKSIQRNRRLISLTKRMHHFIGSLVLKINLSMCTCVFTHTWSSKNMCVCWMCARVYLCIQFFFLLFSSSSSFSSIPIPSHTSATSTLYPNTWSTRRELRAKATKETKKRKREIHYRVNELLQMYC